MFHRKPDPEEQAKEWRRNINHEVCRQPLTGTSRGEAWTRLAMTT